MPLGILIRHAKNLKNAKNGVTALVFPDGDIQSNKPFQKRILYVLHLYFVNGHQHIQTETHGQTHLAYRKLILPRDKVENQTQICCFSSFFY